MRGEDGARVGFFIERIGGVELDLHEPLIASGVRRITVLGILCSSADAARLRKWNFSIRALHSVWVCPALLTQNRNRSTLIGCPSLRESLQTRSH